MEPVQIEAVNGRVVRVMRSRLGVASSKLQDASQALIVQDPEWLVLVREAAAEMAAGATLLRAIAEEFAERS